MNDEERIDAVLSAVANVLLDKGDGYSVGQLVADLEGDGNTHESDPYHVWDRHFLQDMEKQATEWRDEPRDFEEVESLMDAFYEYWSENTEKKFCQIVCMAHAIENGISGYNDESPYQEPIDNLGDDQLRRYLNKRLEKEDFEVEAAEAIINE